MKRNKTIHNEQYNDLINSLSDERKRLGLSQTEVAVYMGMTQSDISKIEASERRLDIIEFKTLISMYRVKDNSKLRQKIIDFLAMDINE